MSQCARRSSLFALSLSRDNGLLQLQFLAIASKLQCPEQQGPRLSELALTFFIFSCLSFSLSLYCQPPSPNLSLSCTPCICLSVSLSLSLCISACLIFHPPFPAVEAIRGEGVFFIYFNFFSLLFPDVLRMAGQRKPCTFHSNKRLRWQRAFPPFTLFLLCPLRVG